MYKIVLLSVFSLPLFAGFFPATVYTSVQSVNDSSIMLQKPFIHNGMTAVVVHGYDKTLHAINSRLTQTSLDGTSTLISADIIHHDELPTVKTTVHKGDKVIGGYLYNNVLVLAPDADTYARVTKSYNKKWIHPDLFALYLSVQGEGRVSKDNLLHFAKKYQVGLIYIVHKDSEVLLDPISGVVIAKKARIGSVSQGKFPFYMRFDSIESGWFGGSETGNYYDAIGAL